MHGQVNFNSQNEQFEDKISHCLLSYIQEKNRIFLEFYDDDDYYYYRQNFNN